MTEWNIVLVLAELIGLFVLVGKPILTLNKTMAEFNAEMKNIKEQVKNLERDDHDAHKEFRDHNAEQDKMLSDHETRISVLESK